ncbi:MAG: DNA repair protein RecN [Oscillospiraceae bacterium]|nr:DNA repair protein RecN [Oscillospiraceae bacterium]
MLRELSIENLAVIASAVIPLEEGFNAFTGETGAGKSILIHGIQAVLGQRTSKDLVRTGCKKAVISALFSPVSDETRAVLTEYGMDCEDDELLLTREISADGGSIGRVNGRSAPAALLRALGDTLVNIHGQHDNQILLRPERHLDVLDQFGEDCSLLTEYRSEFHALQSCARALTQLKKAEQDKLQRLKELQVILSEIGELDPQPQEDALLDAQYMEATRAEESAVLAETVSQMLIKGEENISDAISAACEQLNRLADAEPDAEPLSDRLRALNIELRDIADEVSAFTGGQLSPAEFDRLNERRNAVNTLAIRYHTDADGLRAIYENALKEVEQIETDADRLEQLSKERAERLHRVTELAKALTAHRQKLAERFSQRVGEELAELNMPRVKLSVAFSQGKLTPNGMDHAEFLISANPGEPPKPIAQIASGGELSRMMLALKAVLAARDAIPTLIFDEIDTGVSGKAAQKIGLKLRALSAHHQVICVTHLAQLATQATHHLLIEKHSTDSSTSTTVTVLDAEARIAEIARIMGGDDNSELLLQTAEEALRTADSLNTP